MQRGRKHELKSFEVISNIFKKCLLLAFLLVLVLGRVLHPCAHYHNIYIVLLSPFIKRKIMIGS